MIGYVPRPLRLQLVFDQQVREHEVSHLYAR